MVDTWVPTFGLRLANGKEIKTTKAGELEHFLNTGGRSIVKEKGGKSKGAKGRGRKAVTRTRDA